MERFGIPVRIVGDFDFYEYGKGVWATRATTIPSVKIETLGIRALRISGSLKPTTAFLRIVGKYASKNVVYLNKSSGLSFLKGSVIQGVCGDMRGYVVVRTENDILGCGMCKEGSLISQIPKKYRPDSSWI